MITMGNARITTGSNTEANKTTAERSSTKILVEMSKIRGKHRIERQMINSASSIFAMAFIKVFR